MSTNTLTDRATGQTILDTFFNDIHQALDGDLVGRGATGIPTSGQNLGTVALPWGTVRTNSLVLGGQTLDPSLVTAPTNRVISGKTRATSNQPAFITPNGAALSLTLAGLTTHLELDINGTSVSVITDIVKSSLTAAAGSGHTALVDDALAAGQPDTRLWGEPQHRKTITIDTVGANITALVGKWAAFKIGAEYFIAYVNSATELTQCRRGYFYDSTFQPMNRAVFSNNDTITLMKLGWIFVENDAATVDVTYNNPAWSTQAPGTPTTGDYWYDMANAVWKRYDGASFVIIDRVLVGIFINNTTACIGARCIDFYANYSPSLSMPIKKSTTEIVTSQGTDSNVSVMGMQKYFGLPASWNITTDLATAADMYSATEQPSTLYYLYIDDEGQTVMSDISPYFRGEQYGEYHPHNPWRCVGLAYNDGSSDLLASNGIKDGGTVRASDASGFGSVYTHLRRYASLTEFETAAVQYVDDSSFGTSFVVAWPGRFAASRVDSNSGGACVFGLSKNIDTTAQGTANLINDANLGHSQRLAGKTVATSFYGGVDWGGGFLKIGEKLHPHGDGTENFTGANQTWTAVTYAPAVA